jgi:peptide/nickel transport system substrate-binding protein
MSRRRTMRLALFGSALISAPSLLAACGGDDDDDDDDQATPTPETGQVDATATSASAPTEEPTTVETAEPTSTESAEEAPTATTEADEGPASGGTLFWGRSTDAANLDIAFAGHGQNDEINRLIHEGLITSNMENEFEPTLAESWEISDDGLVYTFHLREGVTFHDGTSFDAEAVKANYDYLLNPDVASPNSGFLPDIESIDVVDEYSIQLTFSQPYGPMLTNLTNLALAIASPTARSEAGEAYREHPVGTGPFMFAEWVPNDHVTVVPYPDHQNFHSFIENPGAPYLDEVVFRLIPETQTQIASLEAGEVSFLQRLPPNEVRRLEDNEDITMYRNEGGTNLVWTEFMFVRDEAGTLSYKPPFDDIRLRKAVLHGVNVDEIILGIFQGLAIKNLTPFPVGTPGYDASLGEEYGYPFDPDEAKRLIEEVGDVPEIVLWSPTSTASTSMGQIIQNQLQQVGFNVKFEAVEGGVLVEDIESDVPTAHLLTNVSWGGIDPDSYLYVATDWTEGIGHYQAYSPEFKELLAEGRRLVDMDERLEVYREAQRIMLEDAAFLPMFTEIRVNALRSNFKDFRQTPYGRFYFQDVYVED